MSILEKISKQKRKEIETGKAMKPAKLLEQSIFFETPVVSLKQYLQREDKSGIIAEIKRASPSTGILHEHVDVEALSISYMQAGASALSILTDQMFFKGSKEDLVTARKYNYCPILRKDFILDEYQLIEAKSIGADCVLLIAACLTPEKCKSLAHFAKELGLEVLLEVHNSMEIQSHLNPSIDLVGVNNRNLHDFSTNIENSIQLASQIPDGFVRVSESGITEASQVMELKKLGYKGFLIGGYFMKNSRPADACRLLIKELQNLTQ
jgi:indole-3-glycerol phosphate synthase